MTKFSCFELSKTQLIRNSTSISVSANDYIQNSQYYDLEVFTSSSQASRISIIFVLKRFRTLQRTIGPEATRHSRTVSSIICPTFVEEIISYYNNVTFQEDRVDARQLQTTVSSITINKYLDMIDP